MDQKFMRKTFLEFVGDNNLNHKKKSTLKTRHWLEMLKLMINLSSTVDLVAEEAIN